MGAGLLALLGLLLLVYINYRLKKNQAVTLKQKNDQIETLAKELHHRVKNNLQVVSGLLSMQGNRLKNEKARQAMEEGKGRVEAMALIHQKLSIDSVYTIVNMREYVITLCDSIAESYGHDPKAMMLYEGNNSRIVNVNIEKAVPIGLIVNEIVTNAFKHAFNETSKPQVRVSLQNEDRFLIIQIGDNGPGIKLHANRASSTGTHLIDVLVKQLDASITIDNKNGTLYRIKIPLNE
jgi:two-component sensor histidine kinase